MRDYVHQNAAEPILPAGRIHPDRYQSQSTSPSLQEACGMAAGGKGMTLASVNTFLEMSGADREAGDIVSAAGIDISDPTQERGYGR